jgi:hypothetical protein
MKLKFTYAIFSLMALALLFVNNSSGPAEVQGIDRTGGPLSPGPCQACHSSGAFSPGIDLEVLDNDTPVNTYEPGKTYTLRVTANHSGDPAGFGFQAVALKASDDSQAGAFSNPASDIQITTLAGRQYPEHSTRRESNVFEVEWEAPAAGTGEVDFYSSIVVANGAAGSGGDGAAFLNTPVTLTEGVASSTSENGLLEALHIFPNPVEDELRLQMNSNEQQDYQLLIFNLNGQLVLSQRLSVALGEQLTTVSLPEMAAGAYTLQITDGLKSSSRILLKR